MVSQRERMAEQKVCQSKPFFEGIGFGAAVSSTLYTGIVLASDSASIFSRCSCSSNNAIASGMISTLPLSIASLIK